MKKVSTYLVVTATIIAMGTAFVAYSWYQKERRGLGRLTGGITDTAAALTDVPEKLVTGEPMSLREEERGAVGTVVGGIGDAPAAALSFPGRGYEYEEYETEIDIPDEEEEIFSEEEIEEEEE